MKNLETINAILCILSFIIFYCSLYLDFKDHVHGTLLRRVILFVCMLASCSLLIRVGGSQIQQAIILWLLLAVVMFVSKWLQIKGKTRFFEDKINRIVGRKRAVH